jgi:hypothetical protein
MRYSPLVLAALVATTLPTLASAQRVSADIRIGSGPVDGRIVVGGPYHRGGIEVGARDYDRHGYGEVVVYRVHRGYGWWRNRGYRAVTMWYDVDRDRYFDRQSRYDRRDGLREVVIYERDGRYYREQDDRRGGRGYDRRIRDHDRGDHDRDDHRYNRDRD